MSSAYFGSEWGILEHQTLLFRDPTNKKRRIIPFLIEDCTMPAFIEQFAYIDGRLPSESAYKRLLAYCQMENPKLEAGPKFFEEDFNAVKIEKEEEKKRYDLFVESIITYSDLLVIENNVESNGEIWIQTSALQYENERELAEVIRNNLRRKITYIYFIPDHDPVLQENMITLALDWQTDCELPKEEAKQLIKCYLIPENSAYMNILIYNSHKKTNVEPPTVLVKFPDNDIYDKTKYPFIYKVNGSPTDSWKRFLKVMIGYIRGPSNKAKELNIEFNDINKCSSLPGNSSSLK